MRWNIALLVASIAVAASSVQAAKHRMLVLLGLVLLIQTPLEAREAETIILAPSTPWNLDYGDDVCSLRRVFGTGENETVLQFQSRSPGVGMETTLAGKLLQATHSPYGVKVRFGPANLGETTREATVGFTAHRGPVLLFDGVAVNANWLMSVVKNESKAKSIERAKIWREPPPLEIAAVEQLASELHFEQKRGPKLLLRTGVMATPLSGMRDCVDNMIRSWGVDPQVQQYLSVHTQPASNPGTWLSSSDYPTEMLRQGQNAIVRFRLIVGEDGKVISCAVQSAAGPTDFRDWTCGLIKRRAKFRPALDAAGKPVKTYWLSSVRWGIPPDR